MYENETVFKNKIFKTTINHPPPIRVPVQPVPESPEVVLRRLMKKPTSSSSLVSFRTMFCCTKLSNT